MVLAAYSAVSFVLAGCAAFRALALAEYRRFLDLPDTVPTKAKKPGKEGDSFPDSMYKL
jgi:hypothetical protein